MERSWRRASTVDFTLVALLTLACDDTTTREPHPGTDTSKLRPREAGAPKHDASPVDAEVTHGDGSADTEPLDASRSPFTIDGSMQGGNGTARASDADVADAPQPSTPEMSADGATPPCEMDACNDGGTCLTRGTWTTCTCEPSSLPVCDLPLFRLIGQSRTDQERSLYLLSGDGRVAAGVHAFDPQQELGIGATWTSESDLTPLEQDPRGTTVPVGLNFDGSLIAGVVKLTEGGELPVWWRHGKLTAISPEAGEMPEGNLSAEIPPDPEGHEFYVFDSTPDGSVAVGKARRAFRQRRAEAAIWTPDDGIQFLRPLLETHGIDLRNWELWQVDAVSDDGHTLVGLGMGPDAGYRWLVRLPAAAP